MYTLEQKRTAVEHYLAHGKCNSFTRGGARVPGVPEGTGRCNLYAWKRKLVGEGVPCRMAGKKGSGPATAGEVSDLERRRDGLAEEVRRLELRRNRAPRDRPGHDLLGAEVVDGREVRLAERALELGDVGAHLLPGPSAEKSLATRFSKVSPTTPLKELYRW